MESSATATPVSQLSCFSSINRQLQIQRRSLVSFPHYRSRITMRLEGAGTETFSSESTRPSSYSASDSTIISSSTEGTVPGPSEPAIQQTRAAKIHDFCLGIPFGGLVLGGGIIGFLLSGNAKALGSGVLYGGALLALSILSLKIWRKGKSSLPFILGQAALSAALLWKNLQIYTLTKKVLPAGLNIVISAAMLCFYSYVVISGGNPPPKKLKSAAVVSS
ncbi:protein FATTY ACID EXPORT 1, chloroplastic isoform X2 [Punica granatum]|uniref:Protein FATTY ACID EXPORT 1, chloroplastic isoform X2 n=2 Tax=Punica granatum TaxID=22663 RepID=A0A6P8DKB6_PUNGR|nr:protein FATTY ACID EXPORT 1, chloroplastic isoform X2 [Punica granatum]